MIKINNPDYLSSCVKNILDANLSLINDYRKNNQKFYRKFYLKKRSGGLRKIETPSDTNYCRLLNSIFDCFCKADIVFTNCVTGFTKHRSIITNASSHLGSKVIVNIDLRNFFNSVKKSMLISALTLPPFNFSNELSLLLSETVTKTNYLPQGSPLSPILSNIVLNDLDTELSKFCLSKHIRYTRYADDMTFSINYAWIENEVLSSLRNIISKSGFTINEKKFKIKRDSKRLMVTGLKVNDKINVKRNYLRNIKAALHNWEKSDYIKAKIGLMSLRGKIEFVGMVRGKNDHIYQKFLNKYYILKDRDEERIKKQQNDSRAEERDLIK